MKLCKNSINGHHCTHEDFCCRCGDCKCPVFALYHRPEQCAAVRNHRGKEDTMKTKKKIVKIAKTAAKRKK